MRVSPRSLSLWIALGTVSPAEAQFPSVIVLDGDVPTGAETHFFLPFDVPTGVAEIEITHDDLSSANILDWGLEDASGFRGWGGGNTEPAVVAADRASRSYVPGPMTAGTWRVVVGKAKVVELPARYHVVVTLRDRVSLAPQPERAPYVAPAPLETGARWYAGDFHVHSRESGDAGPTLDAIATTARSRGLDFVAISDHNTHTALDFFVDAQARHPDLLFVPSVEFTTYAGHAGVVGATRWVNHRIGVEGVTIESALDAYEQQGGVFTLNHPQLQLGDLCIGCAFQHAVPASRVGAVEIMTTSTTIVQTVFLEPTLARWDGLCDQGPHVAALGGSDDHRAGAGTGQLDSPIGDPTTLVFAESLSTEAILAGVRGGHTIVKVKGPNSPMVELTVEGSRVGDTVHARRATLSARVTGGSGTTAFWVKNGQTVGDVVLVGSDDVVAELPVIAPVVGEDRYRLEVFDAVGRVTVTGHLYLTRAGAATEAGCACRSAGRGSTPSALACALASALGLLRGRRTRRASTSRTPTSSP